MAGGSSIGLSSLPVVYPETRYRYDLPPSIRAIPYPARGRTPRSVHLARSRGIIESAMATPLRNTGLGLLGDFPWGTHFCHFFETKQDLLDTLLPYFVAGLEGRELCLWLVAEPLTTEEAESALRRSAPDVDRHLADGTIEIRSARARDSAGEAL